MIDLNKNIQEAKKLAALVPRTKRGRLPKENPLPVLRKSNYVLLTACWEAYIEDLANEAMKFLLENSSTPQQLPKATRSRLARKLVTEAGKGEKFKSSPIWRLAALGWASEVKRFAQEEAKRLNTPDAKHIDELFDELFGIGKSVSAFWGWSGTTVEATRKRLGEALKTRNEIAHRVASSKSITETTIKEYENFIWRLAVKSSNKLRIYLHEQTGKFPWVRYYWKGTR